MPGKPFVITISHQLGCGGMALGQQLSERLGIPFFDREILLRVAEQLNVAEGVVEGREERLSGFWQSLNRVAVLSDPVECMSMDAFEPDDRELFETEAEVIRQIAGKRSGIFLGRCGRYILRDYPRLFNILVHADKPDRIKRVQGLYCLEEGPARKLMEQNDRDRDAYMRTFARKDWLDARWYDLCINTSSLGLEKTVEAAMLGICEKIAVSE